MTELFDTDESLIDDESSIENADDAEIGLTDKAIPLDARRRLETLLEERRLREELNDFID